MRVSRETAFCKREQGRLPGRERGENCGKVQEYFSHSDRTDTCPMALLAMSLSYPRYLLPMSLRRVDVVSGDWYQLLDKEIG